MSCVWLQHGCKSVARRLQPVAHRPVPRLAPSSPRGEISPPATTRVSRKEPPGVRPKIKRYSYSLGLAGEKRAEFR